MENTDTDAQAKFQDLRGRVLRGEEMSPEEYKTVIDGLREHRKSAATTRGKNKSGGSGEPTPQIDLEGWLNSAT